MQIPSPKNQLETPTGIPIYYQGPDLSEGPLPGVIYFALSGYTTLHEDPFNQPVLPLIQDSIRVFSWDLPFHKPPLDPREAMKAWAEEFVRNPHFFNDFLDICMSQLNYLINQGYLNSEIGVVGLSRGSFIATHLAALDKRIKFILGFAPLTQPQPIEELAHLNFFSYDSIALHSLTHKLINRPLRFYIGNYDTRVSTNSCFEFIKALVDTSVAQSVRSPPVELMIYPSIGYKGHGTPPHIFLDGANWIKNKFLK